MSINGNKSFSSNNVLGVNSFGNIQGEIDDLQNQIDDLQDEVDINTGDIYTLENSVVYITGNQSIAGNKTFTNTSTFSGNTTLSGRVLSSNQNSFTGRNTFSNALNSFTGYGTDLEMSFNPSILDINYKLTNMVYSSGETFFFNNVEVQDLRCTNAIINSVNFNTWYSSINISNNNNTWNLTDITYNDATNTTNINNNLIVNGINLLAWMDDVDDILNNVVFTSADQSIAGNKKFLNILEANNYLHISDTTDATKYTRISQYVQNMNYENMINSGRHIFSGFDNVGSSVFHLRLEYNLATFFTRIIQSVNTITTNILMGTNSLLNNVIGVRNVAIGPNTLQNNIANDNIAIGNNALNIQSASNAFSNTAVGAGAGQYNLGQNNTYLGRLSGQISTDTNIYIKSTAIGWNSVTDASNQITLGTATETTRFMGNTKSMGFNYGPNSTVLNYVTSSNMPIGGFYHQSVNVSAVKNSTSSYVSLDILEKGVYIINIVLRWNQNSGNFGTDVTNFIRMSVSATGGTVYPDNTTIARVPIHNTNSAPPCLNATVTFLATTGTSRIIPAYYCKNNGTTGSDDVDWLITYTKIA